MSDEHDPKRGRSNREDGSPEGGQESEQRLAEYNAEVLDSAPGVREAFMLMLMEVPEPDDDAAVKIVGAILGAERAEDLDKPWDSDGMRDFFEQRVTVHSITRRPSDYKGGLGVYLGCDCAIPRTGDKLFISCGSVSAVAQLVRAHALQAFPLTVIPTVAKKATPNGYWPYHLAIVREGDGS